MNHEVEYIKSFIIKDKKQRYYDLIRSKKGRLKIKSLLCHAHIADIVDEFKFLLPTKNQMLSTILKILKSHNAKNTCQLIFESKIINNEEMELEDALKKFFGQSSGIIISCIPGKLAYYEGEDTDERYIIKK